MGIPLAVQVAAIVALILANGLFALSEFSVIASRRSRLRQYSQEGRKGAVAAEKLKANPEGFLAAVQVGITLFGTIAGVLGGAALVERLDTLLQEFSLTPVWTGPLAVALIAIAITITSVVVGELAPKYIALSHPERFARLVAPPMTIFFRITSVFSRLLCAMANTMVRLLGINRDEGSQVITEDEINQMIYDGRLKGVFDETEEQIIKSVFDFADSTVRRAMRPRTDVVGLPADADSKAILATITETGYSRFPVYEKTIDHVVGVLYAKDLIHQQLHVELIVLSDLVRPAKFVPDSMPLSRLLREFQREKMHLAIVLDEFGGTAGIISLEDILEELVGEIQDEYDEEEQPLVKHSDRIAFANGTVWPGAINELMNTSLPEDSADTLAGLIMDHLGRLPEKDEVVGIADMTIVVLEQQDNRLVRLKLEKTTPDDTVGSASTGN